MTTVSYKLLVNKHFSHEVFYKVLSIIEVSLSIKATRGRVKPYKWHAAFSSVLHSSTWVAIGRVRALVRITSVDARHLLRVKMLPLLTSR